MSSPMYAVIAEGHAGLDEGSLVLAQTPERAVTYADTANEDAGTAGVPLVHRVFVLTEMSESAMWDWGLRGPSGYTQLYVNERAARNCVTPGYALVRSRLGTDTWEAVDTGE